VRTPRYYQSLVSQPLFFRAVADQSRLPVIIDNQAGLSMETVVDLAEHPKIIGVKARRITSPVPSALQVLAGSAATFWSSLLHGACGGILPLANAAPYAAIAIWEAFRTREEDAGRDWQSRILRAALVTTKYGVPGLKHAMDLNGYYGGPPRLPLAAPSPAAQAEIAEAFLDLRG
jgi:4-hydroxy-2-oxoglutarate aldolase